MTKVKFYKDKDGDIFAYFPELPGNSQPGMFTSYAHIGQHSACHENYAKGCNEANYSEYRELLLELIRQGYNNLQIQSKQVFELHRKPTTSEIKQGYGAWHWTDFTASEVVDTKNGRLKKWVKGPDGLRYY